MTHSEFLTIFKKHLLVAEPKRAEILIETESHLAEGQDLGDPKVMARQLNRVHIGWGSEPGFPLAAAGLWIALYIFISAVFSAIGGNWQSISVENDAAALWLLRETLTFIVPIVAMAFLAQRSTRLYRPQPYFFSILCGVYVTAAVAITVTTAEAGAGGFVQAFMGIFLTAGIATLWVTMFFGVALIVLVSGRTSAKKFTRWDAALLASMYLLLIGAGFMVISFLTGFLLQPFDGWLNEMRPEHGSFLYQINSYFEHRPSTPVVFWAYFIGITLFVTRRILNVFRHYHKLRRS